MSELPTADIAASDATFTEGPVPQGAFRVTLALNSPKPRIDVVLLEALRLQKDQLDLKIVSRTAFKDLFKRGRIRIKGQVARPASRLAAGTTHVDILGYGRD